MLCVTVGIFLGTVFLSRSNSAARTRDSLDASHFFHDYLSARSDVRALGSMRASARSTTLTLADLEAVRLALRGGSVIDWHRLNFESREDIDEFIAVQEIQLRRPGRRGPRARP